MFDYPKPTDLPSVRTALRDLNAEIHDQLAGLDVEEFLAPQTTYWSPAGHLRHLIKSVRPLADALTKPKLVLRLLFGKAKRSSRSYDETVRFYLDAVESGRAQAGKYGPSSKKYDMDDAAFRELVLQRWQKVSASLDSVLERWDDKHLDRYQLPHPVLGKLTVREMLFFTIYHNKHHASRVFERRVI